MISAKNILFDLDGTLLDPKLGITKSIQYFLARVDPADNQIMLVQINGQVTFKWR